MRKVLCLCLSVSLLCGCGSVHGLRINNSSIPVGKQKIEKGLYLNNKEKPAHNAQVKHEIISDTRVRISIPVHYEEKQNIPVPSKIPEVLRKALDEYDLNAVGKCLGHCKIGKKMLDLELEYKKNEDCSTDSLIGMLLFPIGTLITPLILLGECSIYITGPLNTEFTLNSPFTRLNQANAGVTVAYQVTPDHLFVNCEEKYCVVVDKNKQIVNEIKILKMIEVDTKRIKELRIKEQKAHEAEIKRLEQIQKIQKKECPNLYRILYFSQQGGYVDPVSGVQVMNRFEEINCAQWLQEQVQQVY